MYTVFIFFFLTSNFPNISIGTSDCLLPVFPTRPFILSCPFPHI